MINPITRIVYLSSACAQSRFEKMVQARKINSQFQNQKFHHLLLKGLVECRIRDIRVISFPPLCKKDSRRILYKREEEEGVLYIYPGYIKIPIINPITRCINTLRYLQKNMDNSSIMVCNIMNYEECMAAFIYCLFHKNRMCAIVTDVPGLTSGASTSSFPVWKRKLVGIFISFYIRTMKRYDAYMFLTSEMNPVINCRNKPYIIVEGLSDIVMRSVANHLNQKYSKRTILYSGGIHREYGIEWLVDSFQKLESEEVELHIYGRGNYESELLEKTKEDSRIKYWGARENSEVVYAQTKSHLLINPRPTNEEYVKYSFPSKVIEYMASGTPLLTTNLPGMPKEYYPYVYLIEQETMVGLTRTLSWLLSLSLQELHQKGQDAKQFVLDKKNYIIQAQKLVKLIDTIR